MINVLRLILPGTLLVSVLLFNGCGTGDAEAEARPGRVQPVEVAPITKRDLTESLLVVGSVAANESTEVRAEISGPIRQIHFQEGQEVEEGEALVQLDDRELQAQLREATARFELAKQTFERNEALMASQSIALSERDRAQAEFERAGADRDLLQVRLERSVIRAPFAGTIGARTISPGDYLDASASISRLEDLSRLKVEFALPDRHAARIEPGARVLLTVGRSTTDTAFQGSVYFVSPVIDRTTRSIQVKAYVDNPPPSLRPGMFVQVEVILEEKEGVLTVPETAILAREGAHLVLILETDEEGRETIGFRPVRVGLRQRGLVEIIPLAEGGLPEGQEVVAAGLGALPLFPGAQVKSRPLRTSLNQSPGS